MNRPDFVIIGAGIAGLSAAKTANEMGYSALILEKGTSAGGTTSLSEGIFTACDPKRQFPLSISDSPEKHFADILASGNSKSNPTVLRSYCYEAMNSLNWLEHLGFDFADRITQEPGTLYPRCHRPKHGSGDQYVHFLLNRRNASLSPIFYDCCIKRFTIEKNQPPIVWFENKSRIFRITPKKAVIICSGGFCANKHLLEINFPLLVKTEYKGSLDCDGQVLIAAQDVGAEAVHMGYFDLGFDNLSIEAKLSDPRKFILLNQDGKRFCREDLDFRSLCEAILIQEKSSAWIVELSEKDTLSHIPNNLPYQRLQQALSKYRSVCRDKKDQLFGKNPAFLKNWSSISEITKVQPKILSSLGGLQINEKAQVLSREQQPILGLYAAGECVGGILGESSTKGDNLSSAVSFARIAIRNASKIAY